MLVGILALQGNFERHRSRLKELGAKTLLVKTATQLSSLDALVIPGGESTTLLKLADESLRNAITKKSQEGLPMLATCAGLILLAKKVSHPEQFSLNLLDVDVQRNAYGRQIDSFIENSLEWSEDGFQIASRLANGNCAKKTAFFEGVFIRAPRITRVGEEVSVLATLTRQAGEAEPVLVKERNILAACFHPELSSSDHSVHLLFLEMVRTSLKISGTNSQRVLSCSNSQQEAQT